jgi:hypothetical protein
MSASPIERLAILCRRLARAEDVATIAAVIAAADALAGKTRNEEVRSGCHDLIERADLKAAKLPDATPATTRRQVRMAARPGGFTPQIRMVISPWRTTADGCLTRTIYADPATPWHP